MILSVDFAFIYRRESGREKRFMRRSFVRRYKLMVSEFSAYKSVIIAGGISALEDICRQLLAEATENDFDAEEIFAIHIALEEAFLNAVKHGNKKDPDKEVRIEYLITPGKFDVSIADDGNGFAPETVPDPRCEENLYKPSGRGLLLMRSFMDVVEYNEAGNCVHMVKCKAEDGSSE